MSETINTNHSVTKSIKPQHQLDRLSSLPDAILTVILSLLPIHSAAATSALSHRFRRLWTGVNRLEFHDDGFDSILIDDLILPQLTSPKLRVFHLSISSSWYLLEAGALESSFREVCRRNPEEILVDVRYSSICVPDCLFNSQSLVVLELISQLNFNLLDEFGSYRLPKLKKLRMNYLLDVPVGLGSLVRSCPVLEELDLEFQLDVCESTIADSVNVVSLNLKILKIDLMFVGRAQPINVSIDAPRLEYVRIRDCTSLYDFVRNPTMLNTACIDLISENGYFEDEEYMNENYLRLMSKFVGGMSSVSSLDLKLDSDTNIFTYLSSVGDGFLPVFRNLVTFEMTLDGIGLSGWKDLLLSLQHFPNLKHLEVNMKGDPPMESNNWCVPGSVPGCLVDKLKTIQIRGLIGIDDDLKLLAYILSNAVVLDELRLDVCIREDCKEALLWKEHKFCKSLFKLPKGSSTCEVVFSGRSATTSSSVFNDEYLTC